MGLSYDPVAKKWNIGYEKIDNKTDYPTNLQTDAPTNLPTDLSTKVTRQVYVTKSRNVPAQETYSQYDSCASKDYKGVCQPGFVQKTRTVTKTEYYGEWENQYDAATSQQNQTTNENNAKTNAQNAKANEINAATNQLNIKLNKENTDTNLKNTKLNQAYDKTVSAASGTRGGDYVQMRDQIRKLDVDATTKSALENYYKAFYQTEKLQRWDSALGAKPQYGDFDPKYYKQQNPVVEAAWKAAVANDDIDITQRYGENAYYLQHYTSQGKPSGLRGNAPEQTAAAQVYAEKKPTDADLQQVRNLQLGVDTNTQTQRLLNIPEIAAEWEKAKNGDPYWAKQAKEKYLNPDKPDEFAALFRLSERPEDQKVRLQYNANTGYGITELEDAVNEAVGEKATVDVKRFGALTQDALKTTIAEMKKAKGKEQALSLLGGFGGFSEVMDINKELTNSIMGDSGVGGMLSFMSGGKAEESLEKSLQNITGVKNNVTYNWQQWFDNTLKKKYEQDLELGYTAGEAKEDVKIQADFARNFIDKYLTPRFNTSRSMDEFVEYLDVRQEEQNPFQTQDMLNATNQVANLRAQMYLDQLKASSDRYFNSDFYFNPTGDKARTSNYAEQASTVASDWEAAKKGDAYWAQQAYRFGVDLNDKDAFARMHFQVKGQGRGYDGAEDILNAGKVQDEIYSNILPALKDEALKQGTVFGQFVTPEEFTDELLKGLDPADKDSWNEVLQRYGITDFKGTVEELKEYVMETLRTGSAQKIREELKYLNEKRKKPTQQVLGLTYIERPEDYKDQQAKPSTELYKTFQSAGYQGTEDEFYEKFFPDLDRSEQTLLTKAGSDSALKVQGLDMSDPFASLGTIESFFGEETPSKKETKTTKDADMDSYFKLGLDDDEDEDYKSKTGSQILGEFTSMFKGL
jgi:hypothetical protein